MDGGDGGGTYRNDYREMSESTHIGGVLIRGTSPLVSWFGSVAQIENDRKIKKPHIVRERNEPKIDREREEPSTDR